MDDKGLIQHVRQSPNNCAILERLPNLGMADAWLVSGAVFQTVWNDLTGRAADFGIKDYDIFYHDQTDLSWEAEDQVIQRVVVALADLEVNIEVRNQARVHLWYKEPFGLPYAPLGSSCEAIDRFLAPVCMVGLQPSTSGGSRLYAPRGLEDLETLTIRPNLTPYFSVEHYNAKARRWKQTWPEITILPG